MYGEQSCKTLENWKRKQKLIEHYGADIRLPDLREEIAQCRRHGQMHDACMVRYVDLIPEQF